MTNLRLERGPADFDLRHQFVSSVVWQLNYYHGENSWERGFLNGWAVSTQDRALSEKSLRRIRCANFSLARGSRSELHRIAFLWAMVAHREVEDRQFGVVNIQPGFQVGGSGLEAARR
jgi:hypothetical protein